MEGIGNLRRLLSSIDHYDYHAVERYITNARKEMLQAWHELPLEQFRTRLQALWQELSGVKREPQDAENAVFLQMGKLEGIISVYEEFFREEAQRQRYVKELAEHSEKAREILRILEKAGDSGLQHKALAEAIHVSTSALSNMMARVIRTGAAVSSHVGKYTFYYLSPAGSHYLKMIDDPKARVVEINHESFAPQGIPIDQKFRLNANNGKRFPNMVLKSVLSDGNTIYGMIEIIETEGERNYIPGLTNKGRRIGDSISWRVLDGKEA